MAYTTPNQTLIFPGKGNRYLHKKVFLRPVGADGSAVATAQVTTPPGRLVALGVDFSNQPATIDTLIKADTTAGVTLFTLADATDVAFPTPVGAVANDEATGATAATDAFSGGFPVRSGVFIDIAQADGQTSGDETVDIDLIFRTCTYLKMDLVTQSGADGAGVVTRFVDLHGPGVLAAVAVDYQNTPATADLIIKADSTGGTALFTRASSQTDVVPKLVGRPGADEALNATAATDGTECGNAFKRGLFFDVAESDAFTSGNERIIVECWIDN